MSVRVSCGVDGGASPRCRTAGIASAAATRAAAPATIHARRPLGARVCRGGRRLRGDVECAFECQAHVADIADALLRVLLEASSQEHDERGRQVAREQTPFRLGANHGRQRVGDVFAGKRTRPRQHLEQHGAECPDVGAAIDRPSPAPAPAPCRRRCRESFPSLSRGRSASANSMRGRARRARIGSIAFARPKSRTFTTPSGRILMFAGLRSRWMMPARARPRAPPQSASRSAAPRRSQSRPAAIPVGEGRPLDQLHDERLGAARSSQTVDPPRCWDGSARPALPPRAGIARVDRHRRPPARAGP